MEIEKRVAFLREQVAACERKVATARNDENRRAWLIAGRGWKKMLENEELKYLDIPAVSLIPAPDELESALKKLAAKAGKV